MGNKSDKGNKIEVEIRDKKESQTAPDTDDQKNPAVDSENSKLESPVSDENIRGNKTGAVVEQDTEKLKAEYELKINALEDRYLRLAAEFDNYKKRMARQYAELTKQANENLISELLEVIDNFERALKAASESADFKALLAGTEMIYTSLYGIMEKAGLTPIDAVGQPFNPDLHEAMLQIDSDEYPEGVVAQEIARGYRLNGRVIRYSRVVVSRGTGDKTNNSDSDSN
nr:nucleotide exchange factor GrpE [candidate division Zixibacteria bacterium]